MKAFCFSIFRKMVVSSVLAVLACGFTPFDAAAVIGVKSPAPAEFKDPYKGGIMLPKDGGEPGGAYKVFIKALYSKDHMRICKLMADPAEVPLCLQQKQALDSTIAMFTQPQSHKVLGGFMKGDEATLNVAYTHKGAPQSTGFVVMKKANNRWTVSSTGGSGSGSVSAGASATADLAGGSEAASAGVGHLQEEKYTGPAYGKWAVAGKDHKGGAWTGTLTISEQDNGGAKYRDCSLDMEAPDGETIGIASECKWNPAKREVLIGADTSAKYNAILSADGKSMTRGKWAQAARTGTWSAAYGGGQPGPEPASDSGAASAGADPEFAVIQISSDMEQYTGKCPTSVAFTANVTFKMPPPEKFSYRWEHSDGKKTRNRVVKPPRNGRMSIREVWRGGKPGEKHDVAMRFVAEAGDAQMILDPPGAKVICK